MDLQADNKYSITKGGAKVDKKPLLLLYNPVAGNRSFPQHLDYFIYQFQRQGYEIHPIRTRSEKHFIQCFHNRNLHEYSGVFVAGGDGSVHMAANELIKKEAETPLGIIPAGTVNDTAYNLGISQDLRTAIETMALGSQRKIDIGEANGRYFMNSCGAGLFSEVAHTTERELKNLLGRTAYYLKGISELPKFKVLDTKLTIDGKEYDELFYLYLIVNGKSAGGFRNLVTQASMEDGQFDFLGIRKCPLNELSVLFAKILMGNYKDKNVMLLQGEHIEVECKGENCNQKTDVDGEEGPAMPLDVRVHAKKMNMWMPGQVPKEISYEEEIRGLYP